eukprot:GDKI01037447.1.p2 GENE.GDKI01037447.1~~GDKI01037447.1.p2  ORF type:complete len:130 (-),score=34.71 GDKI01037447.1:67-456(-)
MWMCVHVYILYVRQTNKRAERSGTSHKHTHTRVMHKPHKYMRKQTPLDVRKQRKTETNTRNVATHTGDMCAQQQHNNSIFERKTQTWTVECKNTYIHRKETTRKILSPMLTTTYVHEFHKTKQTKNFDS